MLTALFYEAIFAVWVFELIILQILKWNQNRIRGGGLGRSMYEKAVIVCCVLSGNIKRL